MPSGKNHYLEERLQGTDRDFLLARAFMPASLRPAMSALFALRSELRVLPISVSEPAVVAAKLAWWQDEWERLATGGPRHPVTRAIGAALPSASGVAREKQYAIPSLQPALSAFSLVLEHGGWETVDELERFTDRLAAPFASLQAVLLGREEYPEDGLAWQGIHRVGLLADLPRWWQAGRPALPLDLVAKLQLDRHQLGHDVGLADRAIRVLAGCISEAMPEQPSRGAAAVHLGLCQLQLESAQSRGLAGMGRSRPMAGLWRAWRIGRRLKRKNQW